MLQDGRVVWVNERGEIVGISEGMGGAEPGFGSDARTRDIMSRLPDADIVGLTGPGVVPGGERSVGIQREAHGVGLPPPPHTYRPLAGVQVVNRGNIATVTLPANAGGPEQRIASIVETPKNCGEDAEVIAVQLSMDLPASMDDPADPSSAIPIDVTAIVEWGVGGAFFSAEVDWGLGVSFSICASFVRISARVAATAAQLIPDVQIVLRASLSYGNPESLNVSSSARRTVSACPPRPAPQILGPGSTSSVIPIPRWSKGLTVVDGSNSGAPDYTLTIVADAFSLDPVAVYTVTSRSNLAAQVEGQFPIPARGRFVTLTNNLGVLVTNPAFIFNLGF